MSVCKASETGDPPTYTVDAALKNGAWPRDETTLPLHNREHSAITSRAKLNHTTSKTSGF